MVKPFRWWTRQLEMPTEISEALTNAEVKALRAAMPADDRTDMQKLLGEPPLHRSALAQKRQEGTGA